jgi:hypothetical protein
MNYYENFAAPRSGAGLSVPSLPRASSGPATLNTNVLRAPIKRGLSQGGAFHFYPLPERH